MPLGARIKISSMLGQTLHRIFSDRLRLCVCGVAVLLTLLPTLPAQADNYAINIDAPAEIKALLEQNLDIVRYRTREDIRDEYLDFLVDHAADQTAGLLATRGYFNSRIKIVDDRTGQTVGTDAQISAASAAQAAREQGESNQDFEDFYEISEMADDEQVQLSDQEIPSYTVVVSLGERAKINSAKLTLEGLITQQDPQRAGELEFDWSLQEDEPFTQDDWSSAKTLLLRKIRSDAYAAARFKDTEALVDLGRTKVDVSADLDSGPYFTLGDVEVTGLRRYRKSIVSNVNLIEPGESYNRDKLLAYQKRLQDLPYFSSVVVDIDADPNNAQLAPIKVNVIELPTSNFQTVLGYGTDAGYRAKVQYSHYNVFKRGWIFDTRYDWQQKERIGQMSLSTPQNKNHYQWSLFAKLDDDRTSSIHDRTTQVGLHYSQKLDRTAISYNLDYYTSRLGDFDSHAWVLGVDWSRFNVDDRSYPRKGYAFEASLSGASKSLGSSSTFVRAYTRYRHFFPFFKKDSLMIRAEAGMVKTRGEWYETPSALLFKAGGSNSLRGYAYQKIGAPFGMDRGEVFPAKYMATGTVEYTHWFNDNWGAAVFYDVGMVTDDLQSQPFYHGAGIGARWRSPVGPIQFDIAYGYPRKRVAPHISIGIMF